MENERFKFRYWHNVNKVMHSNKEHSVLAKNLCNKDSVWVTMQFTGLTDTNGKEIYEGDYIRIDSLFNARVIWSKWVTGFQFQYKGMNDWSRDFFRKESKYEIIGNIYENPELL